MNRYHILMIIFLAAGAFSVAGGVLNWDFFMSSRRAAIFVKIFGRNGARIFYAVLGAAIMTLGVLVGMQKIT